MEIPDSPSRIPESATFHELDENNAMIEVVEPMVEVQFGEEARTVNHAVAPLFHNFSATVTNDKKMFVEITHDYNGDEESSCLIEVPMPQIQELFDWLKRNNHIL
jgi:hypothetical protein